MSKILIVDDEKDIRESLKQLLARGGYTDIVTANDGFEALDAFRAEQPELIISDINMPNCDGYELARRLKDIPNSEFVPIVFLSARTSLKNQQEGFECGVDNYICKPIERSQRPTFLAMISSLLERSTRRKQSLEKIAKCSLTGLPRREAFFTEVSKQITRNGEDGKRSCVAILDIDHFKSVNDTHGHLVGDKILQEFSKTIKDSLRRADYMFRYGGEEFTILFSNSDIRISSIALERIREEITQTKFANDLPITFSAGLYEIPLLAKEDSVEEYVELADEALYRSKKTGRNKIMIFEDGKAKEIEIG